MQLPAHTDSHFGFPQGGVPRRTVISAFGAIDDELRQVKELIDAQLAAWAAPSATLRTSVGGAGMMSYLREQAQVGKLLRPGLVLLSYRLMRDASCKKRNATYAIHNADVLIRVAAIVEIIHDATLLHDDVIDEGQKRRGLPTINSLWGNESAVLLGDFLLSKVFKMCADLEPQITRIIADTTIRICEGELRQIAERENWQLSETEYIDIITEKSAALFSSCCLLGGLLSKGTETQLQSLSRFGLNAGIAFQITDDLLDIIGDESKTGKTPGRDVDKNKLTLAVIHLLRAVDDKEKRAVLGFPQGGVPGSYLVNREAHLEQDARYEKEVLVKMLRAYGSLEYARSRAQQFVAKAIASLAGLKDSNAKDALIETARFMASRVV